MTAPKRRGRPRLTHCHRGHSLDDPANVRLLPNGQRQCKRCCAINNRERYHERKAGAGLPWTGT